MIYFSPLIRINLFVHGRSLSIKKNPHNNKCAILLGTHLGGQGEKREEKKRKKWFLKYPFPQVKYV